MMHVHPSLTASRLCVSAVHPKGLLPCLPTRNGCSRKPGRSLVLPVTAAKSSSDIGGINLRHLERAIRLHSAISNRSIKEFVELIGDECRHCFTSLPAEPLELSKKAFQMLHSFMVYNSVMLVIKPTADYGVDIGIRWIANFAKDNLPMAFGCSISTMHVYEGIVFWRNAKNIIDTLIQMQVAERLEKILLPIIDKLVPEGVFEGKERVALMYSLLSLLIMVVSVIILKNTMV
ncbi:unnamed protein product [Musa acuminata subsp. malaccensis]|uniref:(wild Malaysian banana) hypothetical protein n=1 Tax=Musa acuminata subsp. malaccensis TaxID=214687 RepID=A0A804KL30_MUSAM|nr:unnamed protein product [Musa acuminata subsp. malaccensis]